MWTHRMDRQSQDAAGHFAKALQAEGHPHQGTVYATVP